MNWDDLADETPKVVENPFNAMELAKYFRDKLSKASFTSGFEVVNMLALSAQIKKWQKKQDADTVRRVIDAYFDDPSNRGKYPGWRDFILHADRIAGKLLNAGGNTQPDKWASFRQEFKEKYGTEL